MLFSEWEPIYGEILEDMDYDRESDENAIRVLKAVTAGSDLADDELLNNIVCRKAVVFGNSPGLETDIAGKCFEGTLIASGSAVRKLLNHGILPDITVTDLDGDIDAQLSASSRGSVTVIHGHGDNMDLIAKYAASFKGRIILSTQSKPKPTVFNFGGFTDGDRAVCLARHFGAKDIKLAGFDFFNPNPKEGSNPVIKSRKLCWAKKIIFDFNPDDIQIHY